jgi:ABC-2 type transport system ATP-binding protein
VDEVTVLHGAGAGRRPGGSVSGPVVEACGLRREFAVGRGRRVVAVDGIDLVVTTGESVGFLGPNGAGKSTTIKMLTGILVPTAGRLRVCGLDPVRSRTELARRIGVVFGQRSALWWDLPLRDSFDLLRAIHRVPRPVHRARLDRCVDVLGLADLLATPVRQLSLGQRMRGEVAAALLHAPALLVLDEPTVGLDLVSKERLRAHLREVNATDGVTVLLTTHDLPDVERLCPRVVVVDHGRVVADDDLKALRRRSGGPREVVVDLEAPTTVLDGLPGAVSAAAEAGGLRRRIALRPGASAAALITEVVRRCAGAGVAVRDLTVREPSIEDLVRALYGAGR